MSEGERPQPDYDLTGKNVHRRCMQATKEVRIEDAKARGSLDPLDGESFPLRQREERNYVRDTSPIYRR